MHIAYLVELVHETVNGAGLPNILILSFISPTNAQLICFKVLKFTLKYTIDAPTCFGLTKPSSGSLQPVLR